MRDKLKTICYVFRLKHTRDFYCFIFMIFRLCSFSCYNMVAKFLLSRLFCYMFACSDIYFRLHLLLIIITTTCISLSLRRTSAPIHMTSILGVLGTQETFCIIIADLFERDSFDLFLPEFDKPWVIHLRETCCCSTNLCTWRPNTVYKNRRVHRHQALFWRRCRGGKVKGTHILWLLSLLVAGECSKLFPLNSAIISFCFLFLFSLVRLNGK
jgi:hypothetical protein